jgi:hypothetical protein
MHIRLSAFDRFPAKIGMILGMAILGVLGSPVPCAQAQSTPTPAATSGTPTPVVSADSPDAKPAEAAPALPKGFRGVELGMSLAEVQDILRTDELFLYRGAPDVSLLPRPNEKLLEVQGLSYVKRAFFQFYEDKLFSAIYVMNTDKVDHYSIFTQLSNRYGKPSELSPKESVWIDGKVRLSLERPLTVKYLDVAVLEKLQQAGQDLESWEEMERKDFLESF